MTRRSHGPGEAAPGPTPLRSAVTDGHNTPRLSQLERDMGYETLRYEAKEGVGTITLNRPEACNVLNLALGRVFLHAAREADEDRWVRSSVITGAGKAFCAGGGGKDFADN